MGVEAIAGSADYTVHDAIEHIGFGKFQIVMSVLSGFAFALGSTCVFLGWTIGSPGWGWFCDRYGRRTGLFLSSLICSGFGISTAFAPNFATFVILRGCAGLAIGGITQICTIYSEFVPTKWRAGGIIMLEVLWAIGAAVEAIMAYFIIPTSLGWRCLIVLSSLPLLLFAACCWWIPESARFYIAHGKIDQAKQIVERVAKFNKKPMLEGNLVVERTNASDKEFTNTGVSALLTKSLRRTTLLLWLIWMLISFSYYGMTLYTTKLFQSTDTCHGGSSLNERQNTTDYCIPLKSDDYLDIITTSFSELPGLFFTFLIIDRIGRKNLMSLQLTVFALANYALYFCLQRTVIVAILFVARAVVSGAFMTAYVYTPEIYPTSMRAVGLGTASAFGRGGSMLTPYVAQVIAGYNLVYATLIYGSTGVIGAIAARLLPIETTGREMRDSN